MAQLTRRGFLWQSTAGMATIGVLAATAGTTTRPSLSDIPATWASPAPTAEPLVAYVRNAAMGEIALLVGTREIVVRDVELVARLLKAAR